LAGPPQPVEAARRGGAAGAQPRSSGVRPRAGARSRRLRARGSLPVETASVERGEAVRGCAEPLAPEETAVVARLSKARRRDWPRKLPSSGAAVQGGAAGPRRRGEEPLAGRGRDDRAAPRWLGEAAGGRSGAPAAGGRSSCGGRGRR
jgi:hypothetical protein